MFEYLSQHLWLVWIIITMLCLIIELGSGDFFVTCFALGALVAMISALVDLPIWLQVIISQYRFHSSSIVTCFTCFG